MDANVSNSTSKTSDPPGNKSPFYKQPGFSPLRKLIHLGGACFGLLYLLASRPLVIGLTVATLVLVIIVEWGRHHWTWLNRVFRWFIGPALRQGEEKGPTTGLWSTLGILLSLLLFDRTVAIPAILFAQIGDPAAEAFGRAFGRHRLVGSKTLEGSLGCLGACFVVGLACHLLLDVSLLAIIIGAVTATVVEVLPLPLNDNLYMAPVSGLLMMFL